MDFDMKNCIGACDECSKILYKDDNYMEIKEYVNTIFNFQFCNKKCFSKTLNKYEWLNNYTLGLVDHTKTITYNPENIHKFMAEQSWTIGLTAMEIIQYINQIYSKESKNSVDNKILEDYENYGIIR